jgi:hypothetical protein
MKETRKEEDCKIDSNFHNWVQCDKCKKWRRMPDGSETEDYRNGFLCNFISGVDCGKIEENWRKVYKTIKIKKNKVKGKPAFRSSQFKSQKSSIAKVF